MATLLGRQEECYSVSKASEALCEMGLFEVESVNRLLFTLSAKSVIRLPQLALVWDTVTQTSVYPFERKWNSIPFAPLAFSVSHPEAEPVS